MIVTSARSAIVRSVSSCQYGAPVCRVVLRPRRRLRPLPPLYLWTCQATPEADLLKTCVERRLRWFVTYVDLVFFFSVLDFCTLQLYICCTCNENFVYPVIVYPEFRFIRNSTRRKKILFLRGKNTVPVVSTVLFLLHYFPWES